MTTRPDNPTVGHRLAAMLGAALFLASALVIMPKATDAKVCYCNPCDVTLSQCVQNYEDTLWNIVCNPINPTANSPPSPSGPSGPKLGGIRDCKNLDNLEAYVLNLEQHPCGSNSCLQNCGSSQVGYWVDGVNGCVNVGPTSLCSGSNQVGVVLDGINLCFNVGPTGLCPSNEVGLIVDGVWLCIPLGPTYVCGGSQVGAVVDGFNLCFNVGRTGPCDPNQTGYWVDGFNGCLGRLCPAGYYGFEPNCTPLPQMCPPGSYGLPPNCLNPNGGGGVPNVPNFCGSGVSCVASCSSAATICGFAVRVPSKAVADTLSADSGGGSGGSGTVTESCDKTYDPSLFDGGTGTHADGNKCATPAAPQPGKMPAYGWIYCGSNSDCTTTSSMHVQEWNGQPSATATDYDAIWHDYVQFYDGNDSGCVDPSGNCAGGTTGQAVDRGTANSSNPVYDFDYSQYASGPQCTSTPPQQPGDHTTWECNAAGLYGGFVEVQQH
jgi:hypothetical protein